MLRYASCPRGELDVAVGGGLCAFLLLKDFECHVEDGGVVEHDDAAIGSWLDVHTHVNAEVVVRPTKVVSHCLNAKVQLVGNHVCGAFGQTGLDATKLIESNGLWHNDVDFYDLEKLLLN